MVAASSRSDSTRQRQQEPSGPLTVTISPGRDCQQRRAAEADGGSSAGCSKFRVSVLRMSEAGPPSLTQPSFKAGLPVSCKTGPRRICQVVGIEFGKIDY